MGRNRNYNKYLLVLFNDRSMLGNGPHVLGNGPYLCAKFMNTGLFLLWGGYAGLMVYLGPYWFRE